MSQRRKSIVLAAALLVSSLTTQAADNEREKYPVNLEQKLGAGILNSVTGWVELVKSPVAVSKKEGLGLGLTLGVAKGLGNTIGRTACGLFDVLTFILPTKPLVEPHMIWQDFDTETTYNDTFETYDH